MENRPIRAQVVLMPSVRKDWPNMKRLVPRMGARPMVDSSRPSAPDMRPLTMDLLETPAMIVRPNRLSQKYSADMNFSANWASMGAKKYREMQLRRPPQNELQQAVRLRARVSARRVAKILFILNLPYIFWGLQKADLYYVTYVFYEERGVKKKLHRNFTNIMSIFITQPFLTAKNRAKNSNMHKNTVRRSIV